MGRLACVDVPALPLQLLLRREPAWRHGPAAVAADERAQSRLLWVNAAAHAQGVRSGMRHAAALSLCHSLRAGVVSAAEVAAAVRALTQRLQGHSPHVEPAPEAPGLFWLDAGRLRYLHPQPRAWGGRIAAELAALGYRAHVVVGFHRFATAAIARVRPGVSVLPDAEQERRAAQAVPLAALDVPPDVRDALAALGVETVQGLLGLPPLGVLRRFGAGPYRLHRLAAGALREGLQPVPEVLPVAERLLLDEPEADTTRLLFRLRPLLERLLGLLGTRQQALRALHLRLLLEGAPPVESLVRPATATRDPVLLLDLLRLRLEAVRSEALPPEGGVSGLELLAEGEARALEQLSLFATPVQDGPAAAERALARLRAEHGAGAVVRAVLRAGHLPATAFAWEPLERLPVPRPTEGTPALVRRCYTEPPALTAAGTALPPRRLGPVLAPHTGGGPLRWHGPFPLSGGWWATPQHRDYYRDYHYVAGRRGDLLWVYYDRRTQGWHLQGRVE